LHHKANLESIKRELLEFHNCFFECDPYTRTVEQNWTKFKSTVTDSVTKNVPFKTIRPNSKLPWINKDIERDMKKCNGGIIILLKGVNQLMTGMLKNSINCKIKTAHTNY